MPLESKSFPMADVVSGTYWNKNIAEEKFRFAEVGQMGTLDGVVGERDKVNPLSIYTKVRNIPLLEGEYWDPNGVLQRKLVNYPPGHWHTIGRDPRLDTGSMSHAKLIEYAWKMLAETNPSRPHVSIPTMAAELHELPALVRERGRTWFALAASANLASRWGISPFLSDIRKIQSFVRAASQRFCELRNLAAGKTIRKRVQLDRGDKVSPRLFRYGESEACTFNLWEQHHTTWNTWGTVEWKLAPGGRILEDAHRGLSFSVDMQLAGINSHAALATVWELLPWSWLIEWFSNVGDIIAATNNTTNLTWGRMAVMRTSRCTTNFDLHSRHTWVHPIGWYHCYSERKERWPTYPAIPFPLPSLPTLDAGKWSILLSLAALRSNGYAGIF